MCEPIRPIQKSKTFASQCLNLPEFIDFFSNTETSTFHHHFSYPNARKENESNESKLKDLKYELD